MTKAAKVWGKDLSNFLRMPSTKEYIEALSVISTDKELIKVQRGNGNLPTVGTWGHPKLAVRFAQWLDVKFANPCAGFSGTSPISTRDHGDQHQPTGAPMHEWMKR